MSASRGPSDALHTSTATTSRWHSDRHVPSPDRAALQNALWAPNQTVTLVQTEAGPAMAEGGTISWAASEGYPVLAILPAMNLSTLGDLRFCRDHGIRYPYVTGAMANGIASCEVVEAISRADMLGFFGSAGLSLGRIDAAIIRLKQNLGDRPYGFNLIHSPNEQGHESATVDLYLKHGVRLVEASAYLDLTPHIVRYRLTGIHRDSLGQVVTPNKVVAKVSRVEVASKFLSPAPDRLVAELVAQGQLTREQAELARSVPIAQDVTVEADSGGHTDNRPAITLLPTILALRDRLQSQWEYEASLRVGLGGGIATPASAAAAFAMGAAFIVTGSVNQACVESGSSDIVRQMLAEAGQADVAMAPAADMFEMGVKVQVLKRGHHVPHACGQALRTLSGLPVAGSDTRGRTRPVGEELLSCLDRRGLATNPCVLPEPRSRSGSEGRSRPEAQDGPGFSLVSRPIVPLGERRRGRPQAGLSGLVWPGDGCVQRMGEGLVSRRSEEPHGSCCRS